MAVAKQKIIITGASGMLGSAFTELLSERDGYEVRALTHEGFDVRNREQVLGEISFEPDVVIHTAGIVDADYCEEHRNECFDVHVSGTNNIIELCKQVSAKLFYPQSFLILDGKELPATEETKPNPLSIYGEAKLIAEQKILEALPDALVVRMGGFFGGYEKDKNFVGKFAHFLKKCLLEGVGTVKGTDRIWQPSFTKELARNSVTLLDNNRVGVYNMASQGSASFFDVAKEMVDILNLEKKIEVEEVRADFFKEKCKRPFDGTMENKRLRAEGLDQMSEWRQSLKEYLEYDYFKNIFSL